jgi:hypothetical protein
MPTKALFYVVIDNIEETPVQVDSGFPGGFRPSRFISSPTNLNEYSISRMDVRYYGTYEVKVYRVNQEYADLYGSRQQDSRDLNEPLSNIENGLGIFSAFNSVAVCFKAVKEDLTD